MISECIQDINEPSSVHMCTHTQHTQTQQWNSFVICSIRIASLLLNLHLGMKIELM